MPSLVSNICNIICVDPVPEINSGLAVRFYLCPRQSGINKKQTQNDFN